MQNIKTVRVRARGTSLVLSLEDSEGMREPKIFQIGTTRPTTIPGNYAKSIHLSGAATQWLKEGKLIILSGEEELNNYAMENHFIDKPIEGVDEKRLLNIILGQNLTKIKELFEGEHAAVAFDLAGQNSDKLTQGAIDIIEEAVGISLAHE